MRNIGSFIIVLLFMMPLWVSCNYVNRTDKLFFVGDIAGTPTEILLFYKNDTLQGVSIYDGATTYELQAHLEGSQATIYEFDAEGNKIGQLEGTMKENYFEGTWSKANGQHKKTFKLLRKAWNADKKFILVNKKIQENKPHQSVQITYPYLVNVFGAEEIDYINQKISIFISSAIENFEESVNDMNEEDWKEFSEEMKATLEISYVTACADEALISINFGVLEYAVGAAHPIHYYHAINYDLINRQDIVFEELFELNQLQTLTQYINNKMTYAKDIPCQLGGEPEIMQNFLLKTDTIYFYFDDYVLGAYACGNPVVAVPQSVFLPLIKPSFTHLFQAKNLIQ